MTLSNLKKKIIDGTGAVVIASFLALIAKVSKLVRSIYFFVTKLLTPKKKLTPHGVFL